MIWLHDLSPWIIELNGFGLRWYGLSYVAGFVAAWLILKQLGKRGLVSIPPQHASDAVIAMAVGAVVGGRLGYAVFYQPSLLWTFEASFPFWHMLRLDRGGMASHGGIIGLVASAWMISRGYKDEAGNREHRAPLLHVLDVLPLVATPGVFFGRIANFINGELLGKIVANPGEPAPWWSVRFPQEHLTGHAPELTPAQEAELIVLVTDAAPEATVFEEGYARVLGLVQKGSPEFAERLEPLVSARHPSQLYQAFAEALVCGGLCWILARKRVTTGVLTGVFLMSYGLLRIATEFVRLPDSHFDIARPLGLSRGQWLSVAMIGAGIGVLIFAKLRKDSRRYFGWGLSDSGSEATAS
ncbi:MAG: prolipoprotein diacylglyceryl transferase [Planctomycetota bacterium]